jgi:hypothetical protein
MAGPTGFVQRIKGKVQSDNVYVGKGGVHEYVYATLDIGGGASTTIPNNGVSVVKCSSAPQTVRLDAPVPGIEKTIIVSSMSSGTIAIEASTAGNVTYDGTNWVWHPSTLALVQNSITLVGLSTSQWINLGVSPSVTSTGGTITHGLTTST